MLERRKRPPRRRRMSSMEMRVLRGASCENLDVEWFLERVLMLSSSISPGGTADKRERRLGGAICMG